jgi:hypothetical protein
LLTTLPHAGRPSGAVSGRNAVTTTLARDVTELAPVVRGVPWAEQPTAATPVAKAKILRAFPMRDGLRSRQGRRSHGQR